MENEAILSSAEVASRLGVTSQTVTRLSRNGELNYALVGKRRVYRENDVISFMRKTIYASLPQTIALLK